MSTTDGGRKRKPLPPGLLRFLWVRLAGTTAAQMLLVALAWQMYELTSSAWDLGLVGLVQFLPALLLTIPAGQIVDRVDRRLVLAGALVLQALVAGVLAWASAAGTVSRELILLFCVVIGIARALQMPAQQALLPSLVTPEVLPRALAVSSSVMQVAVIGGPALGGFVYGAGAAAAYGVAFALFVLSLVIVAGIRYRRAAPDRARVTLASVFAGFGFIGRHKTVLGALSLDLFAVLLGGATALLPMFAKDVLNTGAWGLGFLRAAPAAGAFVVGVTLARWPLRHQVGRWMFGAVAVYGFAILWLRDVDVVRSFADRAGGERRGRHGERRHPPDAGAARNARRPARARERRQLDVHRRVESAGRIPRRCRGGLARPGRLGGRRGARYAGRRRALDAPVSGAVPPGSAAAADGREVIAGTARTIALCDRSVHAFRMTISQPLPISPLPPVQGCAPCATAPQSATT